jgi:hypothetical protein
MAKAIFLVDNSATIPRRVSLIPGKTGDAAEKATNAEEALKAGPNGLYREYRQRLPALSGSLPFPWHDGEFNQLIHLVRAPDKRIGSAIPRQGIGKKAV